jgi:LuxR family maltose regulon positive regulatory protein
MLHSGKFFYTMMTDRMAREKEAFMLKLAWLGLPAAEIDGVQIHFETRKIIALLAYLSMHSRGCAREKLADIFWPEFDQAHAMANLRRALGSLTRVLSPDYLEINRESVRWIETSLVELDVLKFQELIQDVRTHAHESGNADGKQGIDTCQSCLDHLEAACELNRGDFLDGLNLPDAPGFDEWQSLTRAELNRELAWALDHWTGALASQAATGQVARGQPAWEKAAAVARRWLSLDRLEPAPHLALVQIYMMAGQRNLAQRQVEEYNRLYQDEFGQVPDKDIRAAFQDTLDQWRHHRGEAPPAPQAPVVSRQVLLKTKLYLPQVKSSRVSRQRLLSKLEGISEHKLLLVSAPAGFGKTSLLAEWAAQTELLVGWLSLDSEDNDPNRFLRYLCAALDSAQDGIANTARTLLETVQMVSPQTAITVLLKDLEAAAEPVVLVLDDYQFITTPAIHDGLTYFLERAGQNLHLVIASRIDPPLSLARMRVEDELLEVRTDDLRFTLEECAEYFGRVMGLDISQTDMQALTSRTEGWAVGLQMAGISLKDASDRSRFIRTFSGSHRYILEYLIQEVLDRQPAHVRDFLLKTSILDRMCGKLCEAVVGHSPEPVYSILDYLERSNLFLIPLDQECQWYRYHHLFADLLRARMQQTFSTQDVVLLHQQAAQWYEQNGFTLEAIHHASLTSNNEWVEQLIEKNYMEMFHRGDPSSMRFWTGKLSKELIYRRPWLCIYEAQSHALFGQLDEADVLLAKAEEHLQGENPSADTKSMLGHLAYAKSRVTGMRGDVHRAIELSLTAREYTPASNQALQSGIGVMLGVGYFLNGDFINSIQVFNETIQSGIAANAINGTVAAYCHLARLYAIQGQLNKSYELYQEAGKFAHDVGGRNLGAMSLVDMGIANVLYELNDLEAALAHIKHSLEFIPLWGNADDIVLAYTTHARILQALGDTTAVMETIEKGIQLLHTSGVFSEAREAVTTAEIRLLLAQGNHPAVERWSAPLEQDLHVGNSLQFENEQSYITLGRVYLAQNRLTDALELLTRLETCAQSGGRMGRMIEILNLKALVLQDMNQPAQAMEVIAKGLALAEPEGYVRIFLDEGAPMQHLLAQFSSKAPAGPIRDYALRLK